MASGLVRCAISTVMDEEELQMKTARLEKLRETGKLVLERAGDGEANLTAFDSFSEQLTSFHVNLRMFELPKIWSSFLSGIKVESKDQLFQQSVNQKLYEMMLQQHFSATSLTLSPTPARVTEMTTDELNALQYAAGYIPHALLKKYEKRTGQKYEEFIECLGYMAVQSEYTDFLEYTNKWIE